MKVSTAIIALAAASQATAYHLFPRAIGDGCTAPEGKGTCQTTSNCKFIIHGGYSTGRETIYLDRIVNTISFFFNQVLEFPIPPVSARKILPTSSAASRFLYVLAPKLYCGGHLPISTTVTNVQLSSVLHQLWLWLLPFCKQQWLLRRYIHLWRLPWQRRYQVLRQVVWRRRWIRQWRRRPH